VPSAKNRSAARALADIKLCLMWLPKAPEGFCWSVFPFNTLASTAFCTNQLLKACYIPAAKNINSYGTSKWSNRTFYFLTPLSSSTPHSTSRRRRGL